MQVRQRGEETAKQERETDPVAVLGPTHLPGVCDQALAKRPSELKEGR